MISKIKSKTIFSSRMQAYTLNCSLSFPLNCFPVFLASWGFELLVLLSFSISFSQVHSACSAKPLQGKVDYEGRVSFLCFILIQHLNIITLLATKPKHSPQ